MYQSMISQSYYGLLAKLYLFYFILFIHFVHSFYLYPVHTVYHSLVHMVRC